MKINKKAKQIEKQKPIESQKEKNTLMKKYPFLESFLRKKKNKNFIRSESHYNNLFTHIFINQTHFDINDISFPSDQIKNSTQFLKNTLKKTFPFKRIFSSFLVPWISVSECFLSENSFKKVHFKKKKEHFTFSVSGEIKNYNEIQVNEIMRNKSIEYSSEITSNKKNIFITDQIYNKIKKKNFILLFTVKTISNIKIIKFTDLKILKVNFKEAIELYAYEQLLENIKSTECQIYESNSSKIYLKCSSSFNLNNQIKRMYDTPNERSNIKFYISKEKINKLIPVDKKGKRRKYLDWLNGIDLADGNYISRNKEIFQFTDEGYVFTGDGLVIKSAGELK